MNNKEPQSYYQRFLEAHNGKLFYLHMALIAFVVTEFKESSSDILSSLITQIAFFSMLYGLFKSISHDAMISKLREELTEKGLWYFPSPKDGERLSFLQYLKILPSKDPAIAQPAVGLLIFSYYLYATNGITSNPLDLAGWIWFLSIVALAVTLILFWVSIQYQSISPFLKQLFKARKPISFIVRSLVLIGNSPVLAMILHLIIRISLEPELSFGDSIFTHQYQVYVFLYMNYMNSSVFERVTYLQVLNPKK